MNISWRRLQWYLRELAGENAYSAYLQRHRESAATCPALTRRQFDDRRATPSARCC